jgi:16S rRNA (guanine1207-N2)-methyltransferase
VSGAVDTLFLPFAAGDIDLPADGARFAFLNAAVPQTPLDTRLKSALVCEQGFRPEFLRLERAGFTALPTLDASAGTFHGGLVLAGKHRGENHAMIARACELVTPGAPLLVAGDKNLGIASLRKWVGGHVEIEGSFAKYHATVFWFSVPGDERFSGEIEPPSRVDGLFDTAAGMFSSGKVDKGSALLTEHLGKRVSGAVADFGCGWGYLSAHVLEKAAPRSLALFDAHYPSLKVAERNLAPIAGDVPVATHWLDLASEPVARQFDWIVMNPPFHAGRASEPDIGKAFIAVAAKALKPNGRLLMVANRKLPYEQTLTQAFRRQSVREERDGFKLIEATR